LPTFISAKTSMIAKITINAITIEYFLPFFVLQILYFIYSYYFVKSL